MWRYVAVSFLVAGSVEHGDKPLISIKLGNFLPGCGTADCSAETSTSLRTVLILNVHHRMQKSPPFLCHDPDQSSPQTAPRSFTIHIN
jgi:hypothetical protein